MTEQIVEQLQQELASIKQQRQQEQQANAEMMVSLQNENQQLSQVINDKKGGTFLSQLKQKINSDDTAAKMRQELDTAKQEAEKWKDIALNQEKELQDLEDELEAVRNAPNNVQKQDDNQVEVDVENLNRLQTRIDDQLTEIQALRDSLKSSDEANARLKDEIQTKQDEMRELDAEMDELVKQVKAAQAFKISAETLAAENSALKAQYNEVKQAEQELQQQLETLNNDLEKFRGEAQQMQALQYNYDELNHKYQELTQEANESRDQANAAQQELQSTRDAFSQAQEQIQALQSGNAAVSELQQQLESQQTQSKQLQDQVNESQARAENLAQEVLTLRATANQIAELQDVAQRCSILEQRLNEEAAQLAEAQLLAERQSGLLSQQEQQLEDFAHQVQQRDDEIAKLQESLQAGDSSQVQLLRDKDEQLQVLNERSQALQDQLAEVQAEVIQLRAEVVDAHTAEQNSKDACALFQVNCENATQQLEQQTALSSRLSVELQQLKEENANATHALQAELSVARSDLVTCRENIAALTDEIQRISAQNASLQQAVDDSRSCEEQLQGKVEACEHEVQLQLERCATCEQELHQAEARLVEQQQRAEALDARVQEFEKQVQNTQGTLFAAQNEQSEVVAAKEALQVRVSQMQSEISTYQLDQQKLNAEVLVLQQQNASLSQCVYDEKAKAQEFETKVNTVTEELHQSQQENAALVAERTDLNAKINHQIALNQMKLRFLKDAQDTAKLYKEKWGKNINESSYFMHQAREAIQLSHSRGDQMSRIATAIREVHKNTESQKKTLFAAFEKLENAVENTNKISALLNLARKQQSAHNADVMQLKTQINTINAQLDDSQALKDELAAQEQAIESERKLVQCERDLIKKEMEGAMLQISQMQSLLDTLYGTLDKKTAQKYRAQVAQFLTRRE